MIQNETIALDKETIDLVDLFSILASIPAISKAERPIADELKKRFEVLGFTVKEDDAGMNIGGNAGNLFVFPPQYDSSKPALVFTSHMDTARSTSGLKVIQHEDRITSDGTTQLGVDNRAGLTILSYLMTRQIDFGVDTVNYFCVFTVAEEIGLFGAYQIDLSAYPISGVYVFDSAKRPGTYIAECAGMHLFEVEIKGKAAHSAVAPEKGVSAIQVAAESISKLKLGRLEEFTTANVGVIRGGDATNVIAPVCFVEGEVRALDMESIQGVLDEYETVFNTTALQYGAQISFLSKKDFNPYQIAATHHLRLRLEQAMIQIGLTPNPVTYTGGSDANVYNEKGLPAINLGIGAQNPHGNDEFMLYDDFKSVLKLAIELLRSVNK